MSSDIGTITETCSCGATFTLDYRRGYDDERQEARDAAASWRESHRHDRAASDPKSDPEPPASPKPEERAQVGVAGTTAAAKSPDEAPPVFGFTPRRHL